MYNAVISMTLALLLTACVGPASSTDATPKPQPITEPELSANLISLEARLNDSMLKQTEQLGRRQHLKITALQQDIRNLKNKLNRSVAAPTPAVNNNATLSPENETQDGKLIVGETESIWLDSVNDSFAARIDTGATTSSLSAQDITVFERDGNPWVSFNMAHEGVDEQLQVETPLVRYVRIRQASADTIERRPVVELNLRLGRLSEKTEFTLTDRSQMTYSVLLGREFLKDIAVVDIARQNVQGKPKRPLPIRE